MALSYAVTWQERDRGPVAGKLEVLPSAVRFVGASRAGELIEEIPYREIAGVHVGHGAGERIAGRPALVLERAGREPIRIASVVTPGILSELAEQIAALHLRGATRTLAVVVPLREGSREAVRELLLEGPPFDAEAVGLDRHEVVLTDREAVFLFEGVGPVMFERLLHETGVWASAEEWLPHVEAPPRLAECVYEWASTQRDRLRVAG